MNTQEYRRHPIYGNCLFFHNGIIEVGIPLDFGIRIGHLSLLGGKNVFWEQPEDMTGFCTPDGWRLRGGHRLWVAPETERTYAPDNDPITVQWQGEECVLEQKVDARLHVIKRFFLRLEENALVIRHQLENVGKDPLTCSLWAISVMAPGGVEHISFDRRDGGMDPWHRFSIWDYTSLGDPRATYTRDDITLRFLPLDTKYKIGICHPSGPVSYENGLVRFEKHFSIDKEREYPDGNVSYETFFSPYMVEMESLSPLVTIASGAVAEHTETLKLISITERTDL